LVVNSSGEIIARSFNKFFNLEEVSDKLPTCNDLIVTEKLDGSLGILFLYKNELVFASRGSFISSQAIEFKKIYYELGLTKIPVKPNHTYLFEIIYQENRIVVDYGKTRTLYCLAIKEVFPGMKIEDHSPEYPPDRCPVPTYNFSSLKELVDSPQLTNKEGYVVYWPKANFRLKLKFEEYKKLHSIATNTSNYSIWKALSSGIDLNVFLEKIPDELNKEIKAEIDNFNESYDFVLKTGKRNTSAVLALKFSSRKEIALYLQENYDSFYRSLIFLLLDNRCPKKLIWKFLEPKQLRFLSPGMNSN